MGFFDLVKNFIKSQITKAEKDNVLVSAIHVIMTENLGWRPKKVQFGFDTHEMEYTKADSPLTELDIKAERVGNKLYLTFEGELKRGGALGLLLEKVFDVDLEKEVKYHLALDLSEFVNDSLEVINEQKLIDILTSYINKIEARFR